MAQCNHLLRIGSRAATANPNLGCRQFLVGYVGGAAIEFQPTHRDDVSRLQAVQQSEAR